MKKKISTILIMLAMMMVMSGCDDTVGYWQIQKIVAGDVVMTEKDVADMGFDDAGSIKLQKSGKCVVNLLGDESKGNWEEEKDGTITINYGKDRKGTAVISKDEVMKFTDFQGTEYMLKK